MVVADQTLTIRELVVRAQGGDMDSYVELIARHTAGVQGTIYNILHSISDMEDVAQDVFLIAQQRLHALEEPAAFTGWVQTIARRTALNVLRKRRHSNFNDGADPADAIAC